jgi:CBS domain-containing protein
MPVWEVMSPSPVTVHPDTPVRVLIALFERLDHNAFPVVDARQVLCGLVTKLDLLRLLRPDAEFRVPDFADVAGCQVSQIMRRGVVTVEPDDPAAAAADLMVTTGLRSLPVVERKAGPPVLMGMLSRGDLLRGLWVESGGASAAVTPLAAQTRPQE